MTSTLSTEQREQLTGKGFKEHEVKAVEAWIAFCADRVRLDNPEESFRMSARLTLCLRHLAPHVQDQWKKRNAEDHLPSLRLWMLGPCGPRLSPEDAGDFLLLSGAVLLAGADGPWVTSLWMEQALNALVGL